MSVQEVWYRGNNLVATAIAALAGVSFLPEAFLEDKMEFKMDDVWLFIFGVVALGWYLKGDNKWKRSIVPPILVTLGFAVKIMGLVIELKDKDDVGDDFGGFILFILATILVWWLFVMTPKILKKLSK